MKAAIAQCPIVTEVETQAKPVSQPAVSAKTESPAAIYTAKSIVIVAGIAMMYVMMNHGQIFKNYLQW